MVQHPNHVCVLCLSSFYWNSPAFVYQLKVDPAKFHKELFDSGMEYVVIAWAGEHLLKNCLQGFCQHLSFDPQSTHVVTISAEFGLTKPLALHTHAIQNLCLESSCICTGKCLLMQWQERCPATSWVHSRDLQTFCHPWATHRSKRNMFKRVLHACCCCLSPMLIPPHFLHNKRILQKSLVWAESAHWKRNIMMMSDLIQTFIFPNMDFCSDRPGFRPWVKIGFFRSTAQ